MRHLTFFQSIKCNLGSKTVKLMKSWINSQKSVSKMHLRISFLKQCIGSRIVLPHLNRFNHYADSLHDTTSVRKFNILFKRFAMSMTRNEIYDMHRQIRATRMCSYKLVRQITHVLPISLCNNFFHTQDKSLRLHFAGERDRLDKKSYGYSTNRKN